MPRVQRGRWLIAGILALWGCTRYKPELPHLASIPPDQVLPIDGVWKSPDSGGRVRIERGRMYVVDPVLNLDVDAVRVRDISQQADVPFRYNANCYSFSARQQRTWLLPCTLTVRGENQLEQVYSPREPGLAIPAPFYFEKVAIDDEERFHAIVVNAQKSREAKGFYQSSSTILGSVTMGKDGFMKVEGTGSGEKIDFDGVHAIRRSAGVVREASNKKIVIDVGGESKAFDLSPTSKILEDDCKATTWRSVRQGTEYVIVSNLDSQPDIAIEVYPGPLKIKDNRACPCGGCTSTPNGK